ncbi:MAG TPA: YARHG domain-containing protein, partial [Chitinophagaceae bacterium]|nr:YARHG domain-containing protein [Chitinophagaceae bacterium]
IQETVISLKKEILSFKRISDNIVQVTVYYELFNPENEKDLIVGFEAESPSGDAYLTPLNGKHRYINDFTVSVNDLILPYKVAIVKDSLYYKNGKVNSYNFTKQEKEELKDANGVDFDYVYYFTAHFNKGITIIKHTYNYTLSSSVLESFDLPYKLTTAKRWANKQIDDFTVNFDLGDFTNYHFDNPFFANIDEMKIIGIGKVGTLQVHDFDGKIINHNEFVIKTGFVQYQAKNFKPQSEISLIQLGSNAFYDNNVDTTEFHTSYSIESYKNYNAETISKSSLLQLKILKNIPFARRGYIFKTKELQDYFSKQFWYMPDPNYEPVVSELTKEEQKFISLFK